jgi:hypothetical protein
MVKNNSCDAEMLFEYPLKVVDMNEFMSHKTDLAWRSVVATPRDERFEYMDHVVNEETLMDGNKLCKQVLFTDCERLKRKFESTYSDHNIQCLSNSINFATAEAAKTFLDTLVDSKRWLFHGSLTYEITEIKTGGQGNQPSSHVGSGSRKRSDSFKMNQINRHLNESTSNLN